MKRKTRNIPAQTHSTTRTRRESNEGIYYNIKQKNIHYIFKNLYLKYVPEIQDRQGGNHDKQVPEIQGCQVVNGNHKKQVLEIQDHQGGNHESEFRKFKVVKAVIAKCKFRKFKIIKAVIMKSKFQKFKIVKVVITKREFRQ